uniref:Uncharacterized protein n=1 Tax=Rhizophora mucronata TaxID=61149 RepID=A0A2P2NGR8_RHIMU
MLLIGIVLVKEELHL